MTTVVARSMSCRKLSLRKRPRDDTSPDSESPAVAANVFLAGIKNSGGHRPKRIIALRSQSVASSNAHVVKVSEMQAYFRLLETPKIFKFLADDICKKISDKYLLAMVFTYFKRAQLDVTQYTAMNFFAALYLANDVEEDEENHKYEIFPWALGSKWRESYSEFLSLRDDLWKKIEYRAIVSRRCCEEVMNIEPEHPAWMRVRPEHHSGATRTYARPGEEDETILPKGPDRSPRECIACGYCKDDHDSLSPGSELWHLSTSSCSSPDLFSGSPAPFSAAKKCTRTVRLTSTFNMSDLKSTLAPKTDGLEWIQLGEE